MADITSEVEQAAFDLIEKFAPPELQAIIKFVEFGLHGFKLGAAQGNSASVEAEPVKATPAAKKTPAKKTAATAKSTPDPSEDSPGDDDDDDDDF